MNRSAHRCPCSGPPRYVKLGTVTALGSLGIDRPGWMADAACLGMDPEIFFPAPSQSTAAARAVCATCPVSLECLRHALDLPEKMGIYGGRSERERRRMRQGRGLVARRCRWVSCGRTFVPRSSGQFYCRADHSALAQSERKRLAGRRTG